MSLSWKRAFETLARRHASEAAVRDSAGETSYEALFARAAGVTRAVIERNLAPRAVVATYLPNDRRAVWASAGVTMSGAAEASINPYLAPSDVEHCLATSGAGILVTTAERKDRLAPILGRFAELEIRDVESIGPAEIGELPELLLESNGWGKIIFTSGTTGSPNGIVHSQQGRWTANILLRASLPIAPAPGLDVMLLTPFSHGASLMAYAYLDGGASVTLLDGVDLDEVLPRLRAGATDQLFAPPTVLAKLTGALKGERINGLRTIFTGTAPLSRELYREACRSFGPIVRLTYGKSEIFNPITILTPKETEAWYAGEDSARTSCVGWPASGVEVRVDRPGSPEGASGSDKDHMPGPVLLRARHQFVGTLSGENSQATRPTDFTAAATSASSTGGAGSTSAAEKRI